MVYSSVMGRTQIYLGDEELDLLDRVGRATGASRSELIRRAIRRTFGERSKAERLQALLASAGSMSDHGPTGAEYVDGRRGDLNHRLVDHGVDEG
jgi:metal-responsive CopG/Arc/MetJ family transcriptional regulator